jgi:hypothetical protein
MDALTPKSLVEAVNISPSYASMILSGDRDPPVPLAISIFRKTGHKIGPLVGQTDEDIEAAARLHGLAA